MTVYGALGRFLCNLLGHGHESALSWQGRDRTPLPLVQEAILGAPETAHPRDPPSQPVAGAGDLCSGVVGGCSRSWTRWVGRSTCAACEAECPVQAIVLDIDVPEEATSYIAKNYEHFDVPVPVST